VRKQEAGGVVEWWVVSTIQGSSGALPAQRAAAGRRLGRGCDASGREEGEVVMWAAAGEGGRAGLRCLQWGRRRGGLPPGRSREGIGAGARKKLAGIGA
jgi:hypothetical protein